MFLGDIMTAFASQGITLQIASGSGVAKNITAVSLGAITEITSTSHGLSVGDVVTFASIGGTTGLNGLTTMVIAVETNTFFVAIDSSAMSAYTSGGTATPATYTAIGEVVDFSGPGGQAAVIDVTHLGSTRKEKLMGLPDEGQFTFNLNLDPADSGQLAAKASRNAQTELGYKLSLTDTGTTVLTWNAYCLAFNIAGGVDKQVTAFITLEITGGVAWA